MNVSSLFACLHAHVYLSVCSTLCVLIYLSIILCMSVCLCVCRSCLSVCLSVYRSVWTRSVNQFVGQSINMSVGRSIGRSVSLSMCLFACICLNLSVTCYRVCVECALATKHPMAWLACILLLSTSANRLIIGLFLSLQHSALRVTVVQPQRAPHRLLRQATPAAGLEPAAAGSTRNHPTSQHERC